MDLMQVILSRVSSFQNALIQREQPTNTRRQHFQPIDTAINEDSALTYSAVWGAVRVITETIGVLNWNVMDLVEDGKTKHRKDLYLDYILSVQANPEMTAQVFRETLTAHVMLWGNGYAEIVRDQAGRPAELWPLLPHQVTPKRRIDGQLFYEYRPTRGEIIPLEPHQVLHIKGLGYDGVVGYDVISYNARAVGQGIAAEDYSTAFYRNGAHISGALIGDKPLSEPGRKEVRDAVLEAEGGPKKAHGLLVLGNNYRYEKFSVSPEASQLIENRKFSVTEIARIFRIPPHMLGDLERATFSNIEHQSINFAQHTIRPWVTRWQTEAAVKLIALRNRRRLTTRMDIESITRGDLKTRYQAYKIGREWGWLNSDAILEQEGMDPIGGVAGTTYLVPLNFQDAEKINDQLEPPKIGPIEEDEEIPPDEETEEPKPTNLRPVIIAACERVTSRERNTLGHKWKQNMPNVNAFAEAMSGWFSNQEIFTVDILTPVIESAGIDDARAVAEYIAADYRLERETVWHLAADENECPETDSNLTDAVTRALVNEVGPHEQES